jgi:hypothetical protein
MFNFKQQLINNKIMKHQNILHRIKNALENCKSIKEACVKCDIKYRQYFLARDYLNEYNKEIYIDKEINIKNNNTKKDLNIVLKNVDNEKKKHNSDDNSNNGLEKKNININKNKIIKIDPMEDFQPYKPYNIKINNA